MEFFLFLILTQFCFPYKQECAQPLKLFTLLEESSKALRLFLQRLFLTKFMCHYLTAAKATSQIIKPRLNSCL